MAVPSSAPDIVRARMALEMARGTERRPPVHHVRRLPKPAVRPDPDAQWDEVRGLWVEWDEATEAWVEADGVASRPRRR